MPAIPWPACFTWAPGCNSAAWLIGWPAPRRSTALRHDTERSLAGPFCLHVSSLPSRRGPSRTLSGTAPHGTLYILYY